MTAFGRAHLDVLLRVRAALVALGLLALLLLQSQAAIDSSFLLVLLLGLDLGLSLVSSIPVARLGQVRATRIFLAFDLLVIAAVVQVMGVESGLAALYAIPPFIALLLLERHEALLFAVAASLLCLTQLTLQRFIAPVDTPALPLFARAWAQSMSLLVVFIVMFTLAYLSVGATRRQRQDRAQAAAAQTLAEHTQKQCTLVNSVALRIQEAKTPQQVFTTIGEELERLGLRGVILEWVVPNLSMRISYVSQPSEQLRTGLEEFHINLDTFRLSCADQPMLARAVTLQTPILVDDPLAFAQPLLPQFSPTALAQTLRQFGVVRLGLVPMHVAGQARGVLIVYGKTLAEKELPFFVALANQTALALEKARLLSEQQKRAAQLEMVSGLFARMNLTGIQGIPPILQQVCQEFGYHNIAVFEIDAARKRAVLGAANGFLADCFPQGYAQDLSEGILGMVARSGEMYLARDVETDPYFTTPLVGTDGTRSELAIPLKQGGGMFGILDVQSAQTDAFDPHDVTALSILAEQLGIVYAKAHALAAEQKRAAHLAWVGEVAAQAGEHSEPEKIVKTLVAAIQARFGYHHVSFSIYDAARQEMELRAVAGDQAGAYRPRERWSAERGLIGLAARTGQTVMSGDVQNDPRYLHYVDPGSGTNSELSVPFLSGERVLGVLDVESRKRNAFDSNDIGAMETLANQLARVLERSYLLEIEQRGAAQMALVNRIASRTARLVSTGQLLWEAVELIQTQFGYYNVAVVMRDEPKQGWYLIANAGGLNQILGQVARDLERGIIVQVGASGLPYLCVDVAQDPHYVSPFPPEFPDPVQSELALPLRRGSNVIGVLDIQSDRLYDFSPADITALQVLADQLAAAMENARLYEVVAQRAAQLDAVRVLALQVTAERDLETLLQAIVSNAMTLAHADGATLDLLDEGQGDLVVHISRQLAQDYTGQHLQVGQGLAGRVAQQGEPLIIDDYATWDGRVPELARQEFAGMMAIPLKWQTRVLGVISLHRQRGRAPFNQEELELANLFAAQAAIALENARLFDALGARLDAQQALTETSGALLELNTPQPILDQATQAALRVLDSQAAVLFLAQKDQTLSLASCAGHCAETLSDANIPVEFHGVIADCFASKKPAIWQATGDQDNAWDESTASLGVLESGVAVPMQVGERAVGVIVAAGRFARRYDATDAQTLALLANQTASALERAQAYRQEQQRVRELNLLYESYRATASTLEPNKVIQRLLEQLVYALDATSAYFVRANLQRHVLTQTHEYYSPYAHETERRPDNRIWEFDRVPGIQELLLKPAHAAQATDASLPLEMRAYMLAYKVHTILRVPLSSGEQSIGYISLWETRAPRLWKPDEIRFVQTMASQAVVALMNAQSYQAAEARSRELQALYESGRLLNSSLDIQTICENSVDALRAILGYHYVAIYFVKDDLLRLQVERGYDTQLDKIPLNRGIMARAVTTRQTIFLPDVSQDPAFLRALPSGQSEIAVPLLAGERVLGVLNVEMVRTEPGSAHDDFLTAADAQLLSTYANQLAIAIENARLFHETQQHLNQVRMLHAAGQVVNSELELDIVLERVAEQFVRALGVDSCTLTEWDRATDELVLLVDHDSLEQVREKPGTRFRVHDSFEAAVLQQDRVVALHADDPTNSLEASNYLQDYAWQSVLLVPLIGKGHVIGIVELGARRTKRFFSGDELHLATGLAAQAAIAIENAKLYHSAQQRLAETETLYRFARELGGMLDIQALGNRALEAAARLTDFDIGEVSLARQADGALSPLVVVGSADVEATHPVLPRGQGIAGWVVEHGRAVRVGDVSQDPRYHEVSPYIMSELCLPLRIGERTIGVLNLEAKAPDAFDARAEQLLTVFANQLAIAIENARLYEQTKRDAEVKAALLRELSHRVKNNLAAITSLLYMALDERHERREQILSETLGRVQSMSTAHALLARTPSAFVDLLDLGAQVLSDTVRNLAPPGANIRIETAGENAPLAIRQITTLALVLNELATNALRHGFDARAAEPLILRLTVSRQRSRVELVFQDNGKRLPDGFALAANAGLGLTLVRTLVEKDLHGSFTLMQDGAWARAAAQFGIGEDLS